MNFWSQLEYASGMRSVFPWALALFIVAALVLMMWRPLERMRIRAALLLFVLSLIGFLAVATLAVKGVATDGRLYLWFDWATLFCFWIAFVNVASVLIFDLLLGGLRLSPPRILRDLLLAIAYVIVGITLLSIPHVDITGIVATSAVLTAVVGLSFQDTLGNMMGGMALQMEGAISVGDWIRVDNQEGLVKEIRWRHTAIETRNWDTIIFPNSALMKAHVIVLGRRTGQPRQHRQWVYFNVELFESLTDEERQQLASRIRIAPFARGEVMTKQGAEAHWLYIITLGDAEVRFSLDGKTEHVATLHPGDFFGERGMMTGERRSADVIALTDVECYRVDKDSFQEILHKRPEIAEDISQVLARRRAELEAAREDLTEEAKRARMRDHQGDLLQRIRNFFAL